MLYFAFKVVVAVSLTMGCIAFSNAIWYFTIWYTQYISLFKVRPVSYGRTTLFHKSSLKNGKMNTTLPHWQWWYCFLVSWIFLFPWWIWRGWRRGRREWKWRGCLLYTFFLPQLLPSLPFTPWQIMFICLLKLMSITTTTTTITMHT